MHATRCSNGARPVTAGCLLALASVVSASPETQPDEASLIPQARAQRGPLQIAEPMYFALGGGERSSARFQISFSYRLFAEPPSPDPDLSWVEQLHFGFTQTALWDLSSDSNPFEDASYRPSLFYQADLGPGGPWPRHLRVGYEHESNGKDGAASRSIDTLFARGFWELRLESDRHVYMGPKVYAYLAKGDENEDIEDYRGFADWFLAYGDPNDWMATATARVGTEGRGSLQLELTHPVRRDYVPRLGGYLYGQLFTGYGETILNYDRRKDVSLRIGYAIVR